MLGDEYISQHILNELKREQRETAYRVYVTDALYAISRGASMSKRFADVLESLDTPPETRTAEEIKNHMLNKLRG